MSAAPGDPLRGLQSRGAGVRCGRRLRVSHPRLVCLGNDVRLGDDVTLDSEGGVTIGHGSRIGSGATIRTTDPRAEAPPRPVLVGRGVRIGARARLEPGSRLGDGSTVPDGAVVAGEVPGRSGVRDPAPPLADRILRRRLARAVDGTRLFFVPSTGRSGSMSIARLLSSHPEVRCHHERRRQLIRLSTELAHGIVGMGDAEAELDAIYRQSGVYRAPITGDSDHRLFNLIGILARILPGSRFVWLIRDGRQVVASTVARGWYGAEQESGAWGAYRLRGDRCGDVPAAVWASMSSFAKNCWYWRHVNESIERQLEPLQAERWRSVRLEELDRDAGALFRFLGADPIPVPEIHANVSRWRVVPPARWSTDERASFERWCGDAMDRWYPEWRT